MNKEAEEHEQQDSGHTCKREHCGKRRSCGRILFGVLAIIGVVWLAGAAFGPDCGYAGFHHRDHHWSEADLSKRMDKMTDRLIDHVDASNEQAQQIKSITDSYATRLQSGKDKLMDSRKAFTRLLTEENINRAELENVRLSTFELLNRNSQELVQMLADIADVLTAEQRQQLAEHAKDGLHRLH
ncbi:hypothetical protein MMIC_P0093 [Mariprofundus micogutta]|uniref:Periplasmic heavy metal sensor n=1 Tax=Mariprofundus micogutta TaxID=1921010 RepID=A0A1L8CJR6_9PROT|nr:hypothetical protein [Mariprofundus micogutta]GAV19164.1 hypothetical protein MMIC_P0093 [Mariprofundus micogutta]